MADLSPGGALAIGVVVGLLSTSIQSIGLTLQRESHLLEDEKEDETARRAPYRRRRWQLGMLMFLIANIVGSTVQITTLPLPVLSTLQASGLVFNTICATVILSEPFTRYSLLGTLLVAAGAVLIGIFGAMAEPSHNIEQLLDLFCRRNFLLWLFGTLFFAITTALLAWFTHRTWLRVNPRMRLVQGLMYGTVSGILSAHTLLVAKSAVELVVRTIVDQSNQFNRWQSWFIILALAVLALTQLYYLHLGLKLCSTSVLYPFVFCVYNIIAILDGLIYFRQASRLPPLRAGLITVGTAILLAGVVALSWRMEEGPAYTPVSDLDSARARRMRSMSRIASPALPHTILTPGMGVEGTAAAILGEEPEDTDAFPTAMNDDDEESFVRPAKPDERTSLLRSSTMAVPRNKALKSPPMHSKRHSGSSLGPAKRRMSGQVAGAADELWDELVESDGYRRRSLDFGTMTGARRSPSGRSPLSPGVRWKDRAVSSNSVPAAPGAKRNGTPGGARHARSRSMGIPFLDIQRLRFWGQGGSSPKTQSAADEIVDSDGTPLTTISNTRPGGRRRATSDNRRGPVDERPNEWLKLQWWRTRWRSMDDLQEGEGEGE